jgi:hypothetical protein
MDENKLQKLKDVDYTVKRVCGNCRFFSGEKHESKNFSTCIQHTYEHQKHTESKRYLSVHVTGYCEKHVWCQQVVGFMHAFAQFMEK